jgi:CRISPR-associated protein Csm5
VRCERAWCTADLAARSESEGRLARHPANLVEDAAIGAGGSDAMRLVSASDSGAVAQNSFRVYLLRVATLESRGGGKLDLGWKQSPRGSVRRAEESTPIFAEMAVPGTIFEGEWHDNAFLARPEIAKTLRRRERLDRTSLFTQVNNYTEQILRLQKQYAESTGLSQLKATIEALEGRLGEIRQASFGCMLPLGWGAGFLSKVSFLNTKDETYRKILSQVGFYARAIQSGLPFPKTRKIVFLANQPASLAGFVHLTVGD